MIKWTGVWAGIILSTGCQMVPVVPQADSGVDPNALPLMASGFEWSLTRPLRAVGTPLRLYIEAAQQSTGLTLGRRLSLQDAGSFYAQLPCIRLAESGRCDPRYLNSQRDATEQAEAMARMLGQFKRQQQAKTLEVVAIGEVASLILKVAALGGDIDHLHTLDGTLSPALWARQLKQPPPQTSDSLIYYRQLGRQSQTHWISVGSGMAQEQLAGRYKVTLKNSPCVRLRIARTVSRADDWLKVWPQLKEDRFSCQG